MSRDSENRLFPEWVRRFAAVCDIDLILTRLVHMGTCVQVVHGSLWTPGVLLLIPTEWLGALGRFASSRIVGADSAPSGPHEVAQSS